MKLFKEWMMQHFLQYDVKYYCYLITLQFRSHHFVRENGLFLTLHMKNSYMTLLCMAHLCKTNQQDVCHMHIHVRVITKYCFSDLFSKAWLRKIVPATILSGFKHCSVYPFYPRTVLDHDPCSVDHSTPTIQQDMYTEKAKICMIQDMQLGFQLCPQK